MHKGCEGGKNAKALGEFMVSFDLEARMQNSNTPINNRLLQRWWEGRQSFTLWERGFKFEDTVGPVLEEKHFLSRQMLGLWEGHSGPTQAAHGNCWEIIIYNATFSRYMHLQKKFFFRLEALGSDPSWCPVVFYQSALALQVRPWLQQHSLLGQLMASDEGGKGLGPLAC